MLTPISRLLERTYTVSHKVASASRANRRFLPRSEITGFLEGAASAADGFASGFFAWA